MMIRYGEFYWGMGFHLNLALFQGEYDFQHWLS